jgi:hypothetical protein
MAPLVMYSALFALRDAVPKAGNDTLEPLCECLASGLTQGDEPGWSLLMAC